MYGPLSRNGRITRVGSFTVRGAGATSPLPGVAVIVTSRGTSSGVRGALTAAVSRSVVPVKAAVTPAGRPVAVNVSGPAEPLSRVTVIGMSRDAPGASAISPGGTLSATSGSAFSG